MATLKDELQDLARGWRWGRRTLTPGSAEEHTPQKEEWGSPTDWARSELATAARELILRYGMWPILKAETSPEVHGLDNLDGLRGPVFFVSNHTSHLDATLIMTTLPARWQRTTAVGAAKDYFFDVWWRQAFTSLVYGAFPIDRGSRARGGAAAVVRDLMTDGWSIVVFPEGARSPDGWMQRFRHGTARLSIELGHPVVPIGIRGAHQAMPKGRFWPKPGRLPVTIRYGRPLTPAEGESHQDLSRRMTQAVAQLVDEDASSWWESLQRAEASETPSLAGPAGPRWLRAWEGSHSIARRGPKKTWR